MPQRSCAAPPLCARALCARRGIATGGARGRPRNDDPDGVCRVLASPPCQLTETRLGGDQAAIVSPCTGIGDYYESSRFSGHRSGRVGCALRRPAPVGCAGADRRIGPIATGSAMTARGLRVVRAYPGANLCQVFVMIRSGGCDRWRSINLGENAVPSCARPERRGRPVRQPRVPVRPAQAAEWHACGLSAGCQWRHARGAGERSAARGPVAGLCVRDRLRGAIVAIAAIFGIVALAGIISGNPIERRRKICGIEPAVRVGAEKEVVPPAVPAREVMHDPICVTLPPMNCRGRSVRCAMRKSPPRGRFSQASGRWITPSP